MSTTAEKQATGFVMTSRIFQRDGGLFRAVVFQNKERVFFADGCESKQHAEQIARDIMVRYALVERPTI